MAVRIPAPEQPEAQLDPGLSRWLDGTLRKLPPKEWSKRYKTARSAQSGLVDAGKARGLFTVVAVRKNQRTGLTYVYVQAFKTAQEADALRAELAAAAKGKAPRRAS